MTPAKRKFILVDQSICELGGHHYEYAIRVLAAASEDGFDARLVTKKSVSPSLTPSFPVLPIYSFGHWDRPLRVGPFVFRSFPPPRLIGLVRRAAFAATHSSEGPVSGRACGQRASAREFFRPLVTALRSAGGGARFFGLNATKIRQFERDTLRMITALELRAGDIVFFPTLGEEELLGLGRAIRACKPNEGIGWHLLFRRPPAPASVPYSRQAGVKLTQVRKCIGAFAEATRGHSVCFYTDTDQLTRQYNDLGLAKFATLPIPVPSSFGRPRDPDQTTQSVPTILFAGDARLEKGFQLLPTLVADLRDGSPAGTPPRFIIQSNFSVPGGEPVTARALRDLEKFVEDGVRLIKEPLFPDAYCAIFHASDISLIPYDRLEYRVRSSGVFAESVAAGLVTVVPSCTWMAAQLDGPIAAYRRALLTGPDRIRVDASGVFDLRQGVAIQTLHLALPEGADHLLVKASALNGIGGSAPLMVLNSLDEGHGIVQCDRDVGAQDESGSWTCMFRMRSPPLRAQLIVTSQNHASTGGYSIEDLAFIKAGRPLPLSAAGVMYADEASLTLAVREVLLHRNHYVKTAAAFSSVWTKRHSPQRLERKIREHQDVSPVTTLLST